MSGTSSVPNTFATQLGLVPAAELDANWTSLTTYINNREITLGTLAARPAASVSGRLYFATDLNGGTLFEDNGVIWTALTAGVSGSATILAPLVLIDATGGGIDRPFMSFQETGSETWRVFYQRPAFFGNSATLSFSPITAGRGALQFSLISADGGQRVAIWDSTTTLPNVPHTGIPPTLAVHGDVLLGDIVSLASNPQTLFIRANKGLPVTAVTQFFSAQGNTTDVDGGAAIIMAPTTGGADSDGYIDLIAFGKGSGSLANTVNLTFRTASNTATRVLSFTSTTIAPLADNAYDLGKTGARFRSEYLMASYVSSNVTIGTGDQYAIKAQNRATSTILVSGGTAEVTAFSTVIQGGTLQTTRALRITLIADYLNSTGSTATFILRMKYGGTTFYTTQTVSAAVDAARRALFVRSMLSAAASAAAQVSYSEMIIGGVNTAGGAGNSAIIGDYAVDNAIAVNSAIDQVLSITVQHGTGSASIAFRALSVQVELI